MYVEFLVIDFRSYASSSAGNLYTVDDGHTKLMLECGLPWKGLQRALGFSTQSIQGVLLSHCHADHSKAAAEVMKAGLDMYASEETIAALGLSGHRAHIVNPLQQFRVGSWAVLPFDTPHDAEGTLGYLLANESGERCLFAVDTAYIKYRFRNLHTIAIECNYSAEILRENVAKGAVPLAHKNRVMRSHMSLEALCDFLKANDLSKVEEIHLLHLSEGNADAEAFKAEVTRRTGKIVKIGEQSTLRN